MADEKSPFVQAAAAAAKQFLRSQAPVQPNGPVIITLPAVLRQLQESIDDGKDPDEPIRLALLLAAIVASQRGWAYKDALRQAGRAWADTESLRPKVETNNALGLIAGAVAKQFFGTDAPQSSDKPVVMSVTGVMQQLKRSVELGTDPEEPIHLSLRLAAIIASQRGWAAKDAILQAGIAWEQTSPLRAR